MSANAASDNACDRSVSTSTPKPSESERVTTIVTSQGCEAETISRGDSPHVQSVPMKQRTIRRWIVLVALGAHAFVPFAVYASANAGMPSGDVCSVFGKARAAAAVPAG